MIITLILFLVMLLIINIPIKCTVCKTKCNEKYHVIGVQESMYHQCPNCGKIQN